MASVFLSYDHEDAAQAAPIAAALEKAGHTVWWDRHIHGGAEYNSEIENAVERSDAVVVLWSQRSVRSAWVRDEAAEGRDQGKLVPVLLDRVKPPMGFRQYQTVDLSSWRGRKTPSRMAELLHALERVGGAATPPARQEQAEGNPILRRLPLRWVAVALAAALALAGLAIWQPWNTDDRTAVAAVLPADASPASQDLARDLLAQLGELRGSELGDLDLAGTDRTDADLLFEVSGVTTDPLSRANVLLLDGKNRSVLWSKAFEAPAAKTSDLRQQIGYTAALVLGCGLEGIRATASRLGREGLKTYLNACAFRAAPDGDPSALIPSLRDLVRQAPGFAGGWAMLLYAESAAMDPSHCPNCGAVRSELTQHIAEARKRHPNLAEAYVAEAMLLPEPAFVEKSRLLDRGLERNPDSAELHRTRSGFLAAVGRLDEALADASRAVALDPLSPAARDGYIASLVFAGRIDEARAELDEAERLWPGATSVTDARFRLHLRQGDPREALRLLHAGALEGSPPHWIRLNEALLQARIDRSPQNVDRAIQEATMAYNRQPRAIYGLAHTLIEFDRQEELFKILLNWRRMDIVGEVTGPLFSPKASGLQKDPRFIQVARRLGLLDFWRRSGKWPDFCSRADLPYDCKRAAAKLPA